MEQENVSNVEEVKTETTENTEPTAEEKSSKTFTQEEFQNALKTEVARKTKNLPSKEELKAYNDWKESQKTETEKQQEKDEKYAKQDLELISTKQENKVLKSGVNVDDVDYVLFKVSKMEGDFEDNLEEFLKENPKYLQKQETEETPKTTGVAVTKIKTNEENGVMAILKAKHPDAFK